MSDLCLGPDSTFGPVIEVNGTDPDSPVRSQTIATKDDIVSKRLNSAENQNISRSASASIDPKRGYADLASTVLSGQYLPPNEGIVLVDLLQQMSSSVLPPGERVRLLRNATTAIGYTQRVQRLGSRRDIPMCEFLDADETVGPVHYESLEEEGEDDGAEREILLDPRRAQDGISDPSIARKGVPVLSCDEVEHLRSILGSRFPTSHHFITPIKDSACEWVCKMPSASDAHNNARWLVSWISMSYEERRRPILDALLPLVKSLPSMFTDHYVLCTMCDPPRPFWREMIAIHYVHDHVEGRPDDSCVDARTMTATQALDQIIDSSMKEGLNFVLTFVAEVKRRRHILNRWRSLLQLNRNVETQEKNMRHRFRDAVESVSAMRKLRVNIDDFVHVHIYTMQVPLFFTLNKLLRESTGQSDVRLAPWKPYIQALYKALAVLPIHKSTPVYRGINIAVDPGLYAKGSVLTWRAFSSSTKSPDVAERFMGSTSAGSASTLFVCHSITARYIRPLSSFKDEEEVLFLPNTMFRVLGTVDSGTRALLSQCMKRDLASVSVFQLKEVDLVFCGGLLDSFSVEERRACPDLVNLLSKNASAPTVIYSPQLDGSVIDESIRDIDGNSILHLTVIEGGRFPELISLVLAAGFRLDPSVSFASLSNLSGYTVVDLAASGGHLGALDVLCQAGGANALVAAWPIGTETPSDDPDAYAFTSYMVTGLAAQGKSALWLACASRQIDCVNYILRMPSFIAPLANKPCVSLHNIRYADQQRMTTVAFTSRVRVISSAYKKLCRRKSIVASDPEYGDIVRRLKALVVPGSGNCFNELSMASTTSSWHPVRRSVMDDTDRENAHDATVAVCDVLTQCDICIEIALYHDRQYGTDVAGSWMSHAAFIGCLPLVDLLLRNGVCICTDRDDVVYSTLLHSAALRGISEIPVVAMLHGSLTVPPCFVERKPLKSSQPEAIIDSCTGDDLHEMLNELTNVLIASVRSKLKASPVLSSLNDAFMLLPRFRNTDLPLELPRHEVISTSVKDTRGNFPLTIAAMTGHIVFVALLLAIGCDYNATDAHGNTALALACENHRFDVAALLIDCGADPTIADIDGFAPIHYCAEGGHLLLVQALLDVGVDPNCSTYDGATPLILSSYAGEYGVAELLLQCEGIDLNRVGLKGSALHVAVLGGHMNVVRLLLGSSIDRNLVRVQVFTLYAFCRRQPSPLFFYPHHHHESG